MLRAAIIGMGVGEQHIAGYEADSRCKVVTICDSDIQKREKLALRYPHLRVESDAFQVLKDPEIDVVSIASYDNAHAEQVVTALENNKHIFVEKPLCQNSLEFNRIVAALKAAPHCKLGSNLILRTYDQFVELKSRITQGKLGDLYYLEGDYDYGRIEKILSGWRGEIPFYSVMQGGGIHMIDLLMWLSNSKVRYVTAVANKIVTKQTTFRHADFILATLHFESNVIGKVTANFGSATPHCHRVAAYGTLQTFFQNQLGTSYFSGRGNSSVEQSVLNSKASGHKGALLRAFVKSLLDGEEEQIDSRQVLDAMSVALAIEQALETGAKVQVQYADI
jgi:predicted dehydrogenase